MNRRWIAPALAAACLGLAGGIFACGTDETGAPEGAAVSPTPTPTPGDGPLAAPPELEAYLVSDDDLTKYPANSPERAFLHWWQALQYDNMVDAYRGITARLRATRSRLQFVRDARDAGGGFTARPQITESRRVGSTRVTLLVNLLLIDASGRVASFAPRMFQMQSESGQWRVADLAYLELKASEGRAARRAAADDG